LAYKFPKSDEEQYHLLVQITHSKYYDPYLRFALFPFGGEENFRDTLMDKVIFDDCEKILDLCCGTGGSTFAIRKKIGEQGSITGMDLSTGRINIAQKKNPYRNVSFKAGDARSTGLENNVYSKVFISFALHEMPELIRLNILKEIKRILCDDGSVIIIEEDNARSFLIRTFLSFWNMNWIPYPINLESRTKKEMLKKGVSKDLLDAGFKNIDKTELFKGSIQIVKGKKPKE
jgi:demethylmenaquinone methyltransferase/2-methoxy-6-polyprenyl-1,4-benzoquinol methylase